MTVPDPRSAEERYRQTGRRHFTPICSLPVAIFAASVLAAGSYAWATDTLSQKHIEHVRDGIPPAVIVEGERGAKVKLAERMQALHVPGVSVAVIHNGSLEWARGFGVTKVGDKPVTAETLFQAASISKPITALAVLHLVDLGKLNLDTDVNEYLKSWRIPDNEYTTKQKVTLRQLLSHTAGVTVDGFGGYLPGEPLPSLLQILDGRFPANNAPIRVDIEPNTTWRYAGGGYVILRKVIEEVTGLPFDKVMQTVVLHPIGMDHSYFEQPLSPSRLDQSAWPHDREGRALKQGTRIFPELSPDGLWTTPTDVARYIIEVQQSVAGKSNRVLTTDTTRLMLTSRLNHFGLGLGLPGFAPFVPNDERHPYFWHGGGNYGFPCFFIAYNGGDAAVVMTNGQNGGELAFEIFRSIAKEYHWPDFGPVTRRIASIDPKGFDRYVGAYRLSPDTFVAITRGGNRLFIQTTGGARQALFPMSVGEFFRKDASPDITFVTDAQGRATELAFMQNGTAAYSAKREVDQAAQAAMQEMEMLNERVKHQVAAANGQRVLRRLIEAIAMGAIDDDLVTPQLAADLRSIQALNQHIFSRLGPVVSMSFKRVNPNGVDTYRITFKTGEGDMDIRLTREGKIDYVRYLPG